jgi:hypothetical protein
MVFRAPTLLNSIDLQCGQRVEKILTVARIMILNLCFRVTVSNSDGVIAD